MKHNIRTLQKTEKDYTALARLFNTFKDAESWPDGFGGDFVFNGDVIKKWYDKADLEAHFIITAPGDPDRIVGVCFCCKSFHHADSWYVELLGVEPTFQGKKLGKTLMLYATEFARKKDVQFLGLNTWPGNMKAMPLYKRQGYRWRPGTLVSMENYIPPILNYPFFKDFFTHCDWYDAYKPEIDQLENREFKGNMAIYTYHFCADQGNTLEVQVDRTVGRISGFHLVRGKGELKAEITTGNSHCFTGIEKIPVTLLLENKENTPKEINVQCIHSPEIIMDGEKEYSFVLQETSEKEITLYAGISHTTDPLDLEKNPDSYSEAEIKFDITCNGSSFSLYCGLVPLRAIDMKKAPGMCNPAPGRETKLYINLINYTKKKQEIQVKVGGDEYLIPKKNNWDHGVDELDSSLEIPVTAMECSTRCAFLDIELKDKNNQIISEKRIPFALFREPKAVTYVLDKSYYIETKELLLFLHSKPDVHLNRVFVYNKKLNQGVGGLIPFLGYPVKIKGSEFFTKEFTHTISRQADGMVLKSSAVSKEKPGVNVIREIFVPDNGQHIRVSVFLKNISTQEIKNLGISLFGGYYYNSRSFTINSTRPFKQGITTTRIREINPDYGSEPEDYKEGWCAIELLRGYTGFIFDKERLEKLMKDWNGFGIQQKIGSIQAGESSTPVVMDICFTNTWQEIRQLWLELYGQNFHGHTAEVSLLKEKTTVGINITDNNEVPYRALIMDQKQREIYLQLRTISKAGIKGTLTLDFESAKATPREFILPEKETAHWNGEAIFEGEWPGRIVKGQLTYDSTGRIYEFPLQLVLYNSEKEIKISRGKEGNCDVIELDNGFLKIKGSKDFAGSLFHLSTIDDPGNYLFSFFPEFRPFCWDNKFIGGIYPKLYKPGTWKKIKCDEINFTERIVEPGKWKGFGFVSHIIQKPAQLRGLQITVDYLTLPDAPLVLVRMEIINRSGSIRNYDAQLSCYCKTSGTTDDLFYVPRYNRVDTYRLRDHQVSVESEDFREQHWAALKAADKKYMLGQILCRESLDELSGVYPLNLSIFELSSMHQNNTIKGDEKQTFYSLFLLGETYRDYTAIARSNFRELRDKE